ncbi:hypothetical protein GCM10008171_32740 [Methylopila jiangsuensis]|uniref:Uncharacterized protein n=1 Tax=Methylopila jiangsuensis TaxID=586230 RepID=A0A9W6JLI3_9HYPH|nr:hypothetical protein [Methylopila jiangsuensis]MDR6284591.1 hypothetical protein [Methylopila jiangsuensis]GLK78020.1 hypothetical protein GCM10008171_32740 [Methylopila jiangsuensis]
MAVIDLQSHRSAALEAAWEAYASAARRAQQTLTIEDGIAAGAAWRRFLDLHMTADQRQRLSAAMLPMELRR